MTKKDFELIARVLRDISTTEHTVHLEDTRTAGRFALALAFADRLKLENLRFDQDKFLDAALG